MADLHPMLVHFPIALFLAGVAVDAAGWALRRESWKNAGLVLVVLGALAAVPAAASGLAAEERVETQLEPVPGGEVALERHEELAILTTGVLLGAAVLRLLLGLGWTRRRASRAAAVLGVYLVAAALGVGMLALAGSQGGELVYRYGAGVGVAGDGTGAPVLRAPAEEDD